jgi:GTP pyrophosphokinase
VESPDSDKKPGKKIFPLNHQPSIAPIKELARRLAGYLTSSELQRVQEAYRFSDKMHLGQVRKSGEPYISHPIAVAEICADWKLDVQAIMAALLHDVIEDQNVKKDELIERFGAPVATLVDGLSKLKKIEFQSQVEEQAENFRKILLAMARDVRVILVKLADRLHNMRTLSVMTTEKKRRIARETMDLYIPIANRLCLNNIYCELQELSFSYLYPLRHRTLSKAVESARGNQQEVVNRIFESVSDKLAEVGTKAHISRCEESLFGIYQKMRKNHLSFSQVLEIYGFRVVVDTLANCYLALGSLHALYKPMPGKFKDYIAIPKLNGYQSLHTTLIGPYGTPVEFRIRTKVMHRMFESGVTTQWLYRGEESYLKDLQQRTYAWLQSLLDIQKKTGDSVEFLENIKVDLSPDSVYVFTPKSKIIALPLGATVLDFAYTIHTDVGDQAVSAKVNHETVEIYKELYNGDIVEVITSPGSLPNPNWLSFVRTGKARSSIRHCLRAISLSEALALGKRLLSQALAKANLDPVLSTIVVDYILAEFNASSLDEIYNNIGIGKQMAPLIVQQITALLEKESLPIKINPVVVYDGNSTSVNFSGCCQPIRGDNIIGQIKYGQVESLIVHSKDCKIARRQCSKNPARWIEVLLWGQSEARHFECRVKVIVYNDKGILAKVATEIGNSDADIIYVSMNDCKDQLMTQLVFTILVEDRVHLARLMRNVRRVRGVTLIFRDRS